MDENLKKYLQEKYSERLGDINTAQAFANLGDVIAGRQVGTTSPFFSEQRKLAESQTLGQWEKEQELAAKRAQAQEALQLKLMSLAQQKELGQQGLDLKRMMAESAMGEREIKRQERAEKEKELNVTQAKQLGIAKIGEIANKQYEEVIAKGYDPTSYKNMADFQEWAPQFMKSPEGKQAVAAQTNWVEAYLRDASGAAIPLSERESYAAQFFPRPGDTPEIVANKAQLRLQKEQNALLAAGQQKAAQFGVPKIAQPPEVQAERKTYQGKIYELVGPNRNDPKSWKVVGE